MGAEGDQVLFPKIAALGLLTPSPGDGDGMQGGVPRSTFARGSVALAFFSGFPSPLCAAFMAQAKHQHTGTALGALRGSAATEAALNS